VRDAVGAIAPALGEGHRLARLGRLRPCGPQRLESCPQLLVNRD
jgi:hypothetical protein